ncbi:hypothetical protein LQV05_006279 [Cryptococcus neoformans]|nr:hypothetical protein LQV05_006279 [Cryptococcus neoformans]
MGAVPVCAAGWMWPWKEITQKSKSKRSQVASLPPSTSPSSVTIPRCHLTPWRVSSTETTSHADIPHSRPRRPASTTSRSTSTAQPSSSLSRTPRSYPFTLLDGLELTIAAHRTFASLKTSLLPALQSLAQTLPISLPASPDDIQFWEFASSNSAGEEGDAAAAGAAGEEKTLRCIENDPGIAGRDIKQLGWPRWKTILVSFRGEDGSFKEPIYTIPDPDDDYGGSEAEA